MEFDIAIVGSGPAGSSTALFLAKKGYKIGVFDKATFPRDKVCGDGLSGKTIKLLKELNIELKENIALFADGVIFSSPDGTMLEVQIPKEKLEETHGFVSKRFDFDNVLFNEVKKKCQTFENAKVVDLIKDDKGAVKGIKVEINNKIEDVNAKVVIGADGANSIVAAKTNSEPIKDDHVFVAVRTYYENVSDMKSKIELHFTESVLPGYFWIFPLPNNRANVGIGMLLSDIKKTRKDLKKVMLEEINTRFKERFKNAKQIDEIKGWSLPLGSNRRKGYGDGYLLVGDACSLIDPFTGEGIGNALLSGKLASIAVERAFENNDFSSKTLSYYDKLLKENLDQELKTMYRLQKLSRYKWLFNMLLKKANKKKELRDLITASLIDETKEERKKLLNPLFWIKALLP